MLREGSGPFSGPIGRLTGINRAASGLSFAQQTLPGGGGESGWRRVRNAVRALRGEPPLPPRLQQPTPPGGGTLDNTVRTIVRDEHGHIDHGIPDDGHIGQVATDAVLHQLQQPGQPIRREVEQIADDRTQQKINGLTIPSDTHVGQVARDTVNQGLQPGQALQQRVEQAAVDAVGTQLQPGGQLRQTVEQTATDTVHTQLQAGQQLRQDVEQIARTAAGAGGAAPAPVNVVDELVQAVQPGGPRRDDVKAAINPLIDHPAIDVMQEFGNALQDPAQRQQFAAVIQALSPDIVQSLNATMQDPQRRPQLETAIRALVAGGNFSEADIRRLADEQIAAHPAPVPAAPVYDRRTVVIGGGAVLAGMLACAVGDWFQDVVGFPWGSKGGTTTVYQQGTPPPSGYGNPPTPVPTQPGPVPTEPIGQTGDFKETGPGKTVQFTQYVAAGSKFLVAAFAIAGTRSYTNGIIAAFDGTIQETIDDGVYGVWDNVTALDHFVGKVRDYIKHDSTSGTPYASANIVIPQDWAGRLPADVRAFVNARNVQYI